MTNMGEMSTSAMLLRIHCTLLYCIFLPEFTINLLPAFTVLLTNCLHVKVNETVLQSSHGLPASAYNNVVTVRTSTKHCHHLWWLRPNSQSDDILYCTVQQRSFPCPVPYGLRHYVDVDVIRHTSPAPCQCVRKYFEYWYNGFNV